MRILFLIVFFPTILLCQSDSLFDCSQDNSLHYPIDTPPVIVGGIDSLSLRIKYPDIALKNKIEGKVFLLVIIDSLGIAHCAEIIRGLEYHCDEEAIRIVKSAQYIPATYRGKPVNMRISIPVRFILPLK